MLTKLEVLKQYLQYVLDNKEEHYWTGISTCHCGCLLQSTSLYTEEALFDHYFDEYIDKVRDENIKGWYKFAFEVFKTNYCEVTNRPFTKVVEQLLSYGFTLDELINLEHLQDKRFIDLDINSEEVKKVDSLITYLTNWINYEEQLVKATTKDKVTVSVTGL